MRRFLSVFIPLLALSFYFLAAVSPVRADWLQDLLFGAQTAKVTENINNANKGSLPPLDIIPAREPSPTGQTGQPASQSVQPQTTTNSNNDLLDLAGGYTVGCSLSSPCTTPVPNDLGSFFANLIGDLLGIRTTGNDMATKYVAEGVPQGAALQVFNRLQKPGQDLAQSGESANPNVLGISLLGYDPMVVAFGASQCQKLPQIPGSNCTETGTLASLPQVTPTPIALPTDIPQISVPPPGYLDPVLALVKGIKTSCVYGSPPIFGVVYIYNATCLNYVSPPISSIIKNIFFYSVTRYKYLQCVAFVQATQVLLWSTQMNKGGNAIDYSNPARTPDGYQYINKNSGIIRVGDLPIWDTRPKSPYGHIAFVSKVYGNNNKIDVCEANWGISGSVNCRTTYLVGTQIIGWLRKI